MRHDAIHPMFCACDRCAGPVRSTAYHAPAVDALRKGMIAGLWVGGILAAGKFGPSLVDWMTAQ